MPDDQPRLPLFFPLRHRCFLPASLRQWAAIGALACLPLSAQHDPQRTVDAIEARVTVLAHPPAVVSAPIGGFVSQLPQTTRTDLGPLSIGYNASFLMIEDVLLWKLNQDTTLTPDPFFALPEADHVPLSQPDGSPFPAGTVVVAISEYRGASLVQVPSTHTLGFVPTTLLERQYDPVIYGAPPAVVEKWQDPSYWLQEAERFFWRNRTQRLDIPADFQPLPGDFDLRAHEYRWISDPTDLTDHYYRSTRLQQNYVGPDFHIPSLTRHFSRHAAPAFGKIDSLALQIQQLELRKEYEQAESDLFKARRWEQYYGQNLSADASITELYRSLKTEEFNAMERAEHIARAEEREAQRLSTGVNSGIDNMPIAEKWTQRRILMQREADRLEESHQLTRINGEKRLTALKAKIAVNEHRMDRGRIRFQQPAEIVQLLAAEGDEVEEGDPLMLINKPDTFMVEWVMPDGQEEGRMFPEGQWVSLFLRQPTQLPGYQRLMRGGLPPHRGIGRYFSLRPQRFYGKVRFRSTFSDPTGAIKTSIKIEFYRPVEPGGWLVELEQKVSNIDLPQPVRTYDAGDGSAVVATVAKPLIEAGDRMDVYLVPALVEKHDEVNGLLLWEPYFRE